MDACVPPTCSGLGGGDQLREVDQPTGRDDVVGLWVDVYLVLHALLCTHITGAVVILNSVAVNDNLQTYQFLGIISGSLELPLIIAAYWRRKHAMRAVRANQNSKFAGCKKKKSESGDNYLCVNHYQRPLSNYVTNIVMIYC